MAFSRGPSIVKDGLVLYLDAANEKSYSETETIWNDLSGNANNGTLVNGPTFSNDKNGAIFFDGVDDYVIINDIYFIDNTFTINMYIKWDDVPKTDMYLFSKENIIKNYFGGYSGDFLSNPSIIIQDPNNLRIYIYGYFKEYNGNEFNHIVVTDTNLDVDTSFNIGTGFNNFPFTPNRFALQNDSKTIYTGQFTNYNGTTANRIVRLNTDGSVDNTFIYGTGFNNYTTAAILDNNGKIYVIGQFTSYNGNTGRNRIIRLNSDGSIDSGFDAGTGFNTVVTDLVVDSNNDIYVVGYFSSYKGQTGNNRIIKILENGDKDTSFNTGTGLNSGNDRPPRIYLTSDNKVFVIGWFTQYNGQPANKMVRLNLNGSIDNTFQSLGFSGSNIPGSIPSSETHLSNFYEYEGNYILSGNFTEYNGVPSNETIILDTSGNIVKTFDVATRVIGILDNGDLIVTTLRNDIYALEILQKPSFELSDSCMWNNGDLVDSDFYISKWKKGKFDTGDAYGMIWQDGVCNYMNAFNIFWEKGLWRNGNWYGSYINYNGTVEDDFNKQILLRGASWSGTQSMHLWNIFDNSLPSNEVISASASDISVI